MKHDKTKKGLRLFVIYESLARSILKNDLGHEFTELEIKRVQSVLNDAKYSYGRVSELILNAGVVALDNSNGQWNEHDKLHAP